MRRAQIFRRKLGTGLHEAFCVERDASVEPPAVRNSARHHKDVPDRALFGFPGEIVSQAHRLKMVFALESLDFGKRPQFDVRRFFDSPTEIARHRFRKRCPSDQHVHAAGRLR
jgi:hypothetical protein